MQQPPSTISPDFTRLQNSSSFSIGMPYWISTVLVDLHFGHVLAEFDSPMVPHSLRGEALDRAGQLLWTFGFSGRPVSASSRTKVIPSPDGQSVCGSGDMQVTRSHQHTGMAEHVSDPMEWLACLDRQ
jgi:hypothetical protein